jgi:hypothetical protein
MRLGHPTEVHLEQPDQDRGLLRPELGHADPDRRQRFDARSIAGHDVARRGADSSSRRAAWVARMESAVWKGIDRYASKR